MKKFRKALISLLVLSLTVSAISCGQKSSEKNSSSDIQITGSTNETISESELTSEDLQSGQQTTENTSSSDIQVTESVKETLAEFEVTSEDLHNGIWDTVITKTKNGSNVSPQLSWEPVEGAQSYIIYMIDTTASNWMHWRSGNITETNLAQGSAGINEYVGPYPPSGEHTYEIFVYALEKPVENIPGKFDNVNGSLDYYLDQISETSKILAFGHISGTYTYGD